MNRAGPDERGGASYGRRAVTTAKWASMQISVARKGLLQCTVTLYCISLLLKHRLRCFKHQANK